MGSCGRLAILNAARPPGERTARNTTSEIATYTFSSSVYASGTRPHPRRVVRGTRAAARRHNRPRPIAQSFDHLDGAQGVMHAN
jgi:hypothetical protein